MLRVRRARRARAWRQGRLTQPVPGLRLSDREGSGRRGGAERLPCLRKSLLARPRHAIADVEGVLRPGRARAAVAGSRYVREVLPGPVLLVVSRPRCELEHEQVVRLSRQLELQDAPARAVIE